MYRGICLRFYSGKVPGGFVLTQTTYAATMASPRSGMGINPADIAKPVSISSSVSPCCSMSCVVTKSVFLGLFLKSRAASDVFTVAIMVVYLSPLHVHHN